MNKTGEFPLRLLSAADSTDEQLTLWTEEPAPLGDWGEFFVSQEMIEDLDLAAINFLVQRYAEQQE